MTAQSDAEQLYADVSGHRPTPPNPDWAGAAPEPVLEPGLPIIDPHHHLWDRPTQRYMRPELDADLRAGHDIRATVFMECSAARYLDGPEHLRPVAETVLVASQAGPVETGPGRTCEVAAGIVAHADLAHPRLDEVLDAHERAGAGRFRGIRHATQTDPRDEAPRVRAMPPGMLNQAPFRAGVARLGARGLSFDAWLYHAQVPELTALAHACPGTTVVLDHVGGVLGLGSYARERDEVRAAWRRDVAALAACPNVVVKLGGMGMIMFGFGFERHPQPPSSTALAEAWRPFAEPCIELFGAGRCMFESNFPVDMVSGSYATTWNAFKRLAAGASAADKAALFAGTAARVYRLPGIPL